MRIPSNVTKRTKQPNYVEYHKKSDSNTLFNSQPDEKSFTLEPENDDRSTSLSKHIKASDMNKILKTIEAILDNNSKILELFTENPHHSKEDGLYPRKELESKIEREQQAIEEFKLAMRIGDNLNHTIDYLDKKIQKVNQRIEEITQESESNLKITTKPTDNVLMKLYPNIKNYKGLLFLKVICVINFKNYSINDYKGFYNIEELEVYKSKLNNIYDDIFPNHTTTNNETKCNIINRRHTINKELMFIIALYNNLEKISLEHLVYNLCNLYNNLPDNIKQKYLMYYEHTFKRLYKHVNKYNQIKSLEKIFLSFLKKPEFNISDLDVFKKSYYNLSPHSQKIYKYRYFDKLTEFKCSILLELGNIKKQYDSSTLQFNLKDLDKLKETAILFYVLFSNLQLIFALIAVVPTKYLDEYISSLSKCIIAKKYENVKPHHTFNNYSDDLVKQMAGLINELVNQKNLTIELLNSIMNSYNTFENFKNNLNHLKNNQNRVDKNRIQSKEHAILIFSKHLLMLERSILDYEVKIRDAIKKISKLQKEDMISEIINKLCDQQATWSKDEKNAFCNSKRSELGAQSVDNLRSLYGKNYLEPYENNLYKYKVTGKIISNIIKELQEMAIKEIKAQGERIDLGIERDAIKIADLIIKLCEKNLITAVLLNDMIQSDNIITFLENRLLDKNSKNTKENKFDNIEDIIASLDQCLLNFEKFKLNSVELYEKFLNLTKEELKKEILMKNVDFQNIEKLSMYELKVQYLEQVLLPNKRQFTEYTTTFVSIKSIQRALIIKSFGPPLQLIDYTQKPKEITINEVKILKIQSQLNVEIVNTLQINADKIVSIINELLIIGFMRMHIIKNMTTSDDMLEFLKTKKDMITSKGMHVFITNHQLSKTAVNKSNNNDSYLISKIIERLSNSLIEIINNKIPELQKEHDAEVAHLKSLTRLTRNKNNVNKINGMLGEICEECDTITKDEICSEEKKAVSFFLIIKALKNRKAV